MIEVSIVIVTWNSGDEIRNCINSIIENTKEINYEIIIVDNNSADNTVRIINEISNEYPDNIILTENKENFGYTIACNQGIKTANGKNIFLLNPDTIIKEDAINKLLTFLNDRNDSGAVAPQLLNSDSTIQYSCRTFPTYADMFSEITLFSYLFPKSRIFARWKMQYFSHNETRVVDQPMAAALMIKKDVLDEIGIMDERFQMFFNDVDICKRIKDNSYKIFYYPDAKVEHAKGVSIYKDRSRMIKIWNEDCLKYFKKHHYNFILYSLLYIGLKVTGFFRILYYKLK